MVSTIASYQMISSNLVRSLQQTARQPDVSRDTVYYLAHIGDVKSIDDFIGDSRLFSYAMKAYGLSDMTYAKAFMHRVLAEGVSGSSAFANKLADVRYREIATAFNFFALGRNATRTKAAQSGTVEKYMRQALEENAGEQNEGVRLALYFERKAPTISNACQILADKALTQVVQTALGISPLTSMADVDEQSAMLAKQIDFEDFRDPARLKRFLQRFSAMWEGQNADPTASSTSPSILIGQPIELGITPISLQACRT